MDIIGQRRGKKRLLGRLPNLRLYEKGYGIPLVYTITKYNF